MCPDLNLAQTIAVLEVSAAEGLANAPLIVRLNPLNANVRSVVRIETVLLANLALLITLLAKVPTSNAKTVYALKAWDVLELPMTTCLAMISTRVPLMSAMTECARLT